ncbi:MAG: NADH-quinone oxidoreductase subunit M [Acidimicrobiales bacterium]|jgi:NADH-quinone oxidoreductase subunit M
MTAHGALLSLASVADQRAFPFLTALVLVPVGAALLALVVPKRASWVIRGVGLAASLGVLGIAAAVLDEFQAGVGGYQMVSQHPWVGSLGISWNLGVDGISLFLVLLTALLFVLALVGAGERSNVKSFTVWILLLEAACLGSFLSLDLLMFFLFFETTLVPIYFIIGGWGHERRNHAAMKFFIYTFTGSAVMLVGILALVSIHQGQTGVTTFDIRQLAQTRLSGTAGVLLLLAFSAAFAVKAPIFPFHTWSPDAYREAPVAGSVLLAGVTAKLGTYGIIRFDLGLFPHATVVLAPVFLTLGVVGIIYGAIVAAVQKDLKRLVAYSSLANIGFIVIGAFALTGEAVSGAVLQMLNHGLVTAALFLLVAMIYRRRQTMSVAHLGGLQHKAPVMAATFTVVALASIGVPGLNSFVGEFLILSGTFLTHRWWAVVATAGVVLAAVYLLWAYQQIFHGPERAADRDRPFRDITWRERAVMAPLVVLIVFLGVYPKPVLDRITPSVDQLVTHVEQVAHPVIPKVGQPTLTDRAEVAR